MNRGFTLLEIIVAIVIIEVALVALVSLNVSISKNGNYLIDKTIAINLAREGAELVRNIRDTDTIKGKKVWDEGIKDITCGTIDYNNPTLTDLGKDYSSVSACGKNCRLHLDNKGFYNHAAGTATKFYRMIKVDSSSSPDYDLITSEVGWKDSNGKWKTVKVINKLYDWQ